MSLIFVLHTTLDCEYYICVFVFWYCSSCLLHFSPNCVNIAISTRKLIIIINVVASFDLQSFVLESASKEPGGDKYLP